MDFQIKIDNLPKKVSQNEFHAFFSLLFYSAYVELFEIAIKIGD